MKRALSTIGVLLVTAAAALANPPSTGSYKGTTSENTPVKFKVTARGKVISNFLTTLAYNGKCGPGSGPNYTAKAARIAIGHGGKFSKKVTLTFRGARLFTAPGRISGTASGMNVHGTVVQYLHGKPNKCYTETYSATKG